MPPGYSRVLEAAPGTLPASLLREVFRVGDERLKRLVRAKLRRLLARVRQAKLAPRERRLAVEELRDLPEWTEVWAVRAERMALKSGFLQGHALADGYWAASKSLARAIECEIGIMPSAGHRWKLDGLTLKQAVTRIKRTDDPAGGDLTPEALRKRLDRSRRNLKSSYRFLADARLDDGTIPGDALEYWLDHRAGERAAARAQREARLRALGIEPGTFL